MGQTESRVAGNVALPHLNHGTPIIATGSTAALMDTAKKYNPGNDPGGMAYVHSKRALANYVHNLVTGLSAVGIRANVVHPTNTNSDMLQSEPMYRLASNEARYVTVMQLRVNAGGYLKWYDYRR